MIKNILQRFFVSLFSISIYYVSKVLVFLPRLVFLLPLLVTWSTRTIERWNKKKSSNTILRFHIKHARFIIGIIDQDSNYIILSERQISILMKHWTSSDAFELGSVSKTFTAALISILVNAGQLSYEDLVNDIIPSNYKMIDLDI